MSNGGVRSELTKEQLDALVESARQRMREKPRIWAPKAGDERVLAFLYEQELETGIGRSTFLILEDIADGQRYSLPAHAVLQNHLKPGGIYLLRYNGTRQGKAKGRSAYHDWSVEEVIPPESNQVLSEGQEKEGRKSK